MLLEEHGDFSRLVNLRECGMFDFGCITGRLKAGYNKYLEKQL
jgi:hypothetical protein